MKTISFFISSTFCDMNFERDCLRAYVMPKIQELYAPYDINIQFIDLRWGVVTDNDGDEENRERDILKICMDVIDNCEPYFICFLGGRYGWIPDKSDITNAGIITNTGRSVTDMECQYGIIQKQNFEKSLVFIRSNDSYEGMNDAGFSFFMEQDPDKRMKLDNMKLSLRQEFSENGYKEHIVDYTVKLLKSNNESIWDFCQLILEKINKIIDEPIEIDIIENESNTINEEYYPIGIEDDIINTISSYRNVQITGGQGMGKSAMASWINALIIRNIPSITVLYHRVGSTPNSYYMRHMLNRWNHKLRKVLYFSEEQLEVKSLEKEFLGFEHFVSKCDHRVIAIIDGVDLLCEEEVFGLFMSRQIPNVTYLFTTNEPLDNLSGPLSLVRFSLTGLSTETARLFIDGSCRANNKQMFPSVINHLLEKFNSNSISPLWLNMCMEYLFSLDEYDYQNIYLQNAIGEEEKIRIYMKELINSLPMDIRQLFKIMLDRQMKRFQTDEIMPLRYIACSKMGLNANTLRQIMKEDFHQLEFTLIKRSMRFAISEHPNSHCWYIKHKSFCECFKEFGDEPIENLYWRMADNIEPFNNDELQDCLYYAMKAGYKEYIYKEYACAKDDRLDLYNRLFKQMFIDDEDNIDRLINCIGDEESLNDSFICNLVFELGSTASGDMSMIRDKINMKILAFIDEQHPPLTETSLHLYTGIAAFSAGRIQMRNGDLPGARNNFERSVKEWQCIIELTNHKEWNEMLQTAKDALEGVKEAEQKKVGFHEFENIIEAIEELAVDEDELIEFCNKRRTEADNLIKIDNTEEAIVFYDEIIMIMGYLAGAHYQSVNLKEFLYLRIRSTYEKAKILYNEDKYQEACMILEDDLIYMDNMITHYANVPNVIDKIIIYYHLLAKVCAITEREVDSYIDQMLHVITMSDHLDVLRNVKIENAGLLVQLSHIMMQTGNTTQARRLAKESIERFKQLIPKDYEGIHHYALAYGISALTMINEDNDKADNVLIKSKITTEISMLELMKSMHKDVRSMMDLGIAYSHMATFYCSIKDYEREVVYIIKKVDLLFEAFQLRIGGQESEYTLEIIVNSLNFTADRVFSIVMGLEQQACVNLLAHLANIYNEILLTPYRENMEAINYYNAMAIQLFDMLHDQSPEYAEGYIISKLMQLHELLKEYGLDPPIVDDFKRTYAKYSDFQLKYIELLKDDFDNYRLLLDKINKCLNEQLNEKND